MTTWRSLTKALRARISTDDVVDAVIGDGGGNVWFNENRRICYVRLHGIQSQLFHAFNLTGCVVEGTWVSVRRVQHARVPVTVLGLSARGAGGGPFITTVEPHGPTHAQPGQPGSDPVDVHPTAIVPFRAQPTNPYSLSVYINSGIMYMNALMYYRGGTVGPLTLPTWGQRTDLLYLTPSGTPVIVQGTRIAAEGALWPSGPDVLPSTKPIALILLRASFGAIAWEQIKPLHHISVGLGMDAPDEPLYPGPTGWFGYSLHHIGPETPIGSIDGVNDTFITEHWIEPDSLIVWLNGVVQVPLVDYLELGSRVGFEFTTPPCTTSEVAVKYTTEAVIR